MTPGHLVSVWIEMRCSVGLQKVSDKDRPDEAFTTDRAVRAGRANAASGRIMVTIPGDHFGPIPPEADPRGQVCTAMPGRSLCTAWCAEAMTCCLRQRHIREVAASRCACQGDFLC